MDIIGKLKQITVEPILLLYMMGSFTQMAVMQDFIYTKVCLDSVYRNICADGLHNSSLEYVQNESSHWLLYTNIALTLPAIFTSLYLGSWCCHYGPKLPLLLPTVGAVIACGINIVLSAKMDTHVAYLLISQFLTGIFGSSICVIMSCMNYVSLTSPLEYRTVRLVILESMIFLGGTIGPFIGGTLKERTGFVPVFTFLLCINVIIFLYAFVRIKNIRPMELKSDSSVISVDSKTEEEEEIKVQNTALRTRVFGIHHCVDTLLACFRKRNDNKRFYILLLLFCAFLNMVCTAGELDTAFFYAKDEPLVWTYEEYSFYFGVKHGLAGLGLLIIAPLLRRFFNPNDSVFVLMGITSKMAGLAFLAFSRTTLMMFFVPIIASLSAFPMPTLRSMLSKLMETNEHGKLFAFVASLEQLCFLLGSVIFNALYPATRPFFHGFVFLLCDVFLFIALAILTWIHILAKRHNTQPFESNSSGVSYSQI